MTYNGLSGGFTKMMKCEGDHNVLSKIKGHIHVITFMIVVMYNESKKSP